MKFLDNIPDRERRLIVPAVIITAFLSVLLFVDIPLYKKGVEFGKKSGEEEKRLRSLISMGQEYISLKNEVEDIRERAFNGSGASLSGIESVVSRAGLKKKLSSVKPTTITAADGMKRIRAELSFGKVSLSEVLRLITFVEADGHFINIEKVSLKATYENPSLFNITLVMNTVERD